MPIDAQTQAFLDNAYARPGPPPGQVPLDDFRAAVEPFRSLAMAREEVAAVDELEIPRDDGSAVAVRLYRPSAQGPLPLMVWIHGGSWVRVTVDLLDSQFRLYANRSRCAIAAVDYRLAPEARFPEQIHESYAAARWLKANAARYGLDGDRIGVGGESSGGNMAAVVALLDRDRGGVGFGFQALVVPVLDATFSSESWRTLGTSYLLTQAQLEWALEQYAPGVARTDPRLSPAHATSLVGLPPTLVITGEFDPLRDEGRTYADRLGAAGVPVTYDCRSGLIHHALMAPKIIDVGRELLEHVGAEIGRGLRKET